MTVRRLTGHDEQGHRSWSAPFAISQAYAVDSCDLGYALTWYTVEGRTVSVGITLASDARDRSGLYMAMSRGRQRNEVYAYPSAQEPAETPVAGSAPDPEIKRQRLLQAARDGASCAAALSVRDPVALLAPVVRRDDVSLSARETQEQSLSDADHLGALHAIWLDQCRAESAARYTRAVRETASPADAEEILKDTGALWRTVRAAELAALDGAHVIRAAIYGRPFTGARSHSAVLDARIRKGIGHLRSRKRESWTASLPHFTDPDLARYMSQIAIAMDDRQRRIGEHAARDQPLWATQAVGNIPADPATRADWERKAGQIGAYREITGYDHPADAIGPEPAATSPDARAAWHAAFAVMARVEGIDVRHLTDGQLLARRRAYQAETSWAPKHVAEELRAARRQEQHSKVESTRHTHEATAATRQGRADLAALHHDAARSWNALGQRATLVREKLAEAHDTRCQWEAMTEPTRRLARASDVELKRRSVLSRDDHLKSAEPQGFAYPEAERAGDVWVQPRLDGTVELPREPELVSPPEREQRALQVLGLTLDYDQDELPFQVSQVTEYNRQRQAEIDEFRTLRIPAEEPDEVDLGEAWTVLADRHRDAVIQPPRPPLPAAEQVLEHAAEREASG